MCFWLCLIGVVGSCVPGVREKLKMAWRHRSSTEKCQLGVIGFLAFALVCFIIAVVAMDLSFKKKIHDLEDEIDSLKSTEAFNTTTPTSTTSSVTTSPSTKHTTSETTTTTSDSTTITTSKPTTTTSTTATTSTVPTTTSTSTTSTSPTTSVTTAHKKLLAGVAA